MLLSDAEYTQLWKLKVEKKNRINLHTKGHISYENTSPFTTDCFQSLHATLTLNASFD